MERIKNAVEKILARVPMVRGKGEEATKQALVLPLLDALGYDIWNPSEVCPEYEADFAIKKAGQKEKVDLAIFADGIPRIYFEVKSVDCPLDGHEGQLKRYFNATTPVCLAVLTNGLEYRFFTDTVEPNVLEAIPFHITNLDAVDQGLEVLACFQKSVFSPAAIRGYARELNHTARIVTFLRDQLDLRDRESSEDFTRWILSLTKICERRVTASVVEDFAPIVKNALQVVLRDIVRRSFVAMENEVSAPAKLADIPVSATILEDAKVRLICLTDNGELGGELKQPIVTTERELECFAILKEQFENSAVANAQVFDATRRREVPLQLAYKDTTGYFGVYFNKPGWWIMRLVLEAKTKWVGFNVDPALADSLLPVNVVRLEPSPWAEVRVAISTPQDLHALSRLVLASFRKTIEDRTPKQTISTPFAATILTINGVK